MPAPVDTAELPRWDLSPFFSSLDDRSYSAAHEGALADLGRLQALHDEHEVRGGPTRPATEADAAVLAELLDRTNHLSSQLRLVHAYLYARVTTDTADDAAANRQAELQQQTVALGVLTKRFEAWVARLGADDLLNRAAAQPGRRADLVADHAFAVRKAGEAAAHQLSEAEEALAAELRPAGSVAWARLHRDLTSRATAPFVDPRDETTRTLPVTVLRGMAHDADPAVRRAAYDAEVEAWAGLSVPLAAALNGAKGEAVVLNRRRGWPDDLAPALFTNNVDRPTLDAMTAAVVDSLPDFHRYLRAKARLIDPATTAGLAWWDLFAPPPTSSGDAGVDWPAAVARVRHAFARYAPSLAGLVDRAVRESWIDAGSREGKVGGAFCLPVRDGESRVLLNFDGSLDAVQTLAHELGHAYHNVNLGERTPLQRQTPMALAETASIFCETIVVAAGLAEADDAARLALLDTDLQGATQVVVDIHSRFLFESELCRRRASRSLAVPELDELMLAAQAEAYSDGVRADTRHRSMWAVKGHYFTPFYNWPYTFGLLFGIGLYRRFEDDPDRFRAGYDELLASTGMGSAAELAGRFGIDIRNQGFWVSSLDILRGRIDEYVALVAVRTAAEPTGNTGSGHGM